jgi:hypothetical protein
MPPSTTSHTAVLRSPTSKTFSLAAKCLAGPLAKRSANAADGVSASGRFGLFGLRAAYPASRYLRFRLRRSVPIANRSDGRLTTVRARQGWPADDAPYRAFGGAPCFHEGCRGPLPDTLADERRRRAYGGPAMSSHETLITAHSVETPSGRISYASAGSGPAALSSSSLPARAPSSRGYMESDRN